MSYLILPYMALYDLYGLQYWNLSTVPGVTLTNSCGHIYEWGQTLIEYTYLLFGMTPMIRSLNFLNRFPWSGLVIKSPVTPFVGNHSTVTFFLFTKSATKKNLMLMFLILLLTEALPFFSSSMALWLS